jgi:hypothetical protein
MLDASPLGLLGLLAMGHFVADFVLQHDRMAVEKCPGADATLPWQWWLLAHAACHGLFVGLLTGVPMLGISEWITHGVIDYFKCKNRYNLLTDQLLHLACKLIWVACVLFQRSWSLSNG